VGLFFFPVITWGITEMYDTKKTFKGKLWQWENQNCTPLSTLYTWNLLALFIISKIKNVALRRVQQTIPGVQNYECRIFVVSFSYKARHWEAPENLKMGLINLQCKAILSQNCSETTLQGFYYCLPKESCLCWNFLGQDWQHLSVRACVCVCVNNYFALQS